MAVVAAELLVRVGADTSSATQSIDSFRSGLNQTAADLGRSGAYLTAGITTPLVGAGVAALKFSTDFNAAMANVASLGLAPERVLELKGNIQDMALEVGKGTDDLADGLYQVVSAFGDTNDTVEILNINARAAAAGLATTTDAINLTSAVTKGYGDTSAEALQHVANLAFKTVEMGQTTFPELASSMGKVVPLAAELGISQEELFAVMATGTGVTGNASEVVTQLRSSMQALMSPTESMTGLIESMGFASSKAMIDQLGYHGSILAITQAAEATGKPLGDFMGRVEGQVLALALAGPQADVYTEKLAAMGDVTGAVDAAFRAQTEGINATGFAMRNAGIRAEILMQKLGDGIAPAIDRVISLAEPLVGWVEGLVDTFTKADEGTQLMIVGLAAFAAAIGPVMLGLAGMAAALAFLLTPIGLVVAAVGLLGSAFITDFGGIRTVTMEAVEAVSAFATDAAGWLSGLITRAQGIHERWAGYITPIVAGYEQIASIAQAALQGDLEPARQAISSAFESIRSFDIGEFVGGLATAGTNLASTILDSFKAIDLTTLRTDIISKLGLDNFKLFPEGTGIDIGSLPADLARVGTSLAGLAASAAEFVGIDLSGLTFDVKGLQTAIIQQLNLVDFAVIAIGLRLKVTKALQDLTWEDITLNAKGLQTAIIQQLALVDFTIIATGLRLKATKAFQDLTWEDVKVGAGDLKQEIIRQLADVDFTQIATGLRLKAQGAFQGIAWDALPPIDVEPLRIMLQTNVDNAQAKLAQFFGTDNVLTRIIGRVTDTFNTISEMMTGAASLAPAERFNRVVSSVVAALVTISAIEYDVLQTATRQIARLAVSLMAFSTSMVDNVDAEAVAGVLRDIVNEFTTQLSALVDADTLAQIGTAAGSLISSFVSKLGEVLGAEGFGEDIGTAVGKATVAIAEGATALVTGITDQLAAINWTEFNASLSSFSTGFIDGISAELATADFSGMAKAIADGIVASFISNNFLFDPEQQGADAGAAAGVDMGELQTFSQAVDSLKAWLWPDPPETFTAWDFPDAPTEFTGWDFPEPPATLTTWDFPEPPTALTSWVFPDAPSNFTTWDFPDPPASFIDWSFPSPSELIDWIFPAPSALLEWIFPPPSDLINWKFPAPMQLLAWAFPAPFALLSWGWPSLPTWTWPAIPRPAWLDNLLNWRPPAIQLPTLPGDGSSGGTEYGFRSFSGAYNLAPLPAGASASRAEQSRAGGDGGIHLEFSGDVHIHNDMDIEQLALEVARRFKNHRR